MSGSLWQKPLFRSMWRFKPTIPVFTAFGLSLSGLPKNGSLRPLALLAAALAAAVQL